MTKVAKLASRLNWQRRPHGTLPRFFLFTDQDRLPDPRPFLAFLPKGAAVVLRHTDEERLRILAADISPHARRLGLRVLLAGDVRLALKVGCDGVHLSQAHARRGPLRCMGLPRKFLITAAAHDAPSLRRAASAGAGLVMLSPVFDTRSHAYANPLGVLRFAILAKLSTVPVVALGGITARRAKRLSLGPAFGIAAIDAWCTSSFAARRCN